MCVVENDVWTYTVGEGQELRGDAMPNPCLSVDAPPWGEWQLPWERGHEIGDEDEFPLDNEADRLGYWLFFVGMMLWEIEAGQLPASHIAMHMPEPRWLGWALRWVLEAQAPEPPPRHHRRRHAAWKRRQLGMICLEAALLGMRGGLELQRCEEYFEKLDRGAGPVEDDDATLWC